MHPILEQIERDRIIAIVRGLAPERMEGLAEALLAGGVTMIEVTFNQQNPDSFGETAAAIRLLATKYAGRIAPGAGTVMTEAQVRTAFNAGARYIISPNVDARVIRASKALGMAALPGALTPTEIALAWEAGADAVKVFPAGALGPGYIKAVKAPLPHIPLMAVGGVNEKNAADFLSAGAVGLGVGGNLVDKTLIASGDWEKITALGMAYRRAAAL